MGRELAQTVRCQWRITTEDITITVRLTSDLFLEWSHPQLPRFFGDNPRYLSWYIFNINTGAGVERILKYVDLVPVDRCIPFFLQSGGARSLIGALSMLPSSDL